MTEHVAPSDGLRSEPSPEQNRVATAIVDAAFTVHRALGPGLLESVYQHCLKQELKTRGIPVQAEVAVPIVYEGVRIDAGFRMDLVVAGLVVVELKAVERVLPIHEAQLFTYLRLSRLKLGLLINFNSILIKDGIKRVVASMYNIETQSSKEAKKLGNFKRSPWT